MASRFADSFATFARPSIDHVHGEAFTYRFSQTSTTKTLTGPVRRAAPPRSEREANGPLPIEVIVSKVDVPDPRSGDLGYDLVTLAEGVAYRVAEVLDDGPGSWKLYCVR